MNRKSDTYIQLIDLLFSLGQLSNTSSAYSHTFEGGKYERVNSGASSTRYYQPILIADLKLCDICNDAEWRLIRTIMRELKEYNALWYCNPDIKKSSGNKVAIKDLIEKNVLFKTETTNIYLVNPKYMRRGDLWAVLTTTANALKDTPRVGIEHISNKKPIKLFNANSSEQLLLGN